MSKGIAPLSGPEIRTMYFGMDQSRDELLHDAACCTNDRYVEMGKASTNLETFHNGIFVLDGCPFFISHIQQASMKVRLTSSKSVVPNTHRQHFATVLTIIDIHIHRIWN